MFLFSCPKNLNLVIDEGCQHAFICCSSIKKLFIFQKLVDKLMRKLTQSLTHPVSLGRLGHILHNLDLLHDFRVEIVLLGLFFVWSLIASPVVTVW